MELTLSKRSFHEVFVSNFHDKLSLNDFLNLDPKTNISIKKIGGRIVIQPSEKLKSILNFLVRNVVEYASISPDAVFSYRKGVNVREAVYPHRNNRFFFQTDIENFFNSLKKTVVKDALHQRLGSVPIADLADFKDIILELVTYDDSLPLGFPTSPALSNTCLKGFDDALLKKCHDANITYTRYADDIILSSNNITNLKSISSNIEDLLRSHVHNQLSLNESKTRFLKRGEKIHLLGLVILPNGQISIEKSDKSEIETLLHFYLSDPVKFLDYAGELRKGGKSANPVISRDTALAMLSGRILGANAMSPQYVMKLRNKYGNTVVDMFIHKSAK